MHTYPQALDRAAEPLTKRDLRDNYTELVTLEGELAEWS